MNLGVELAKARAKERGGRRGERKRGKWLAEGEGRVGEEREGREKKRG